MKLQYLCDAAGIDCPHTHREDEILAIVTDSRRVCSDSLFVCVRGLQSDGHAFVSEAIRDGAKWILAQTGADIPIRDDVTYLYADDTRRALAFLYHAWYGNPCDSMKMIGVTGTNGKSTVTHMITKILSDAGKRCGLIGTLGCFLNGDAMKSNGVGTMTTPDPEYLYQALAEMKRAGAEYVIMETSSHALSLEKVAPIRFCVGIFTNLTPEHLDFHENMEEYAQAKTKLFAQSEFSLINTDSDYADRMLTAANGARSTCSSQSANADGYADEIAVSRDGVSYLLHTKIETIKIDCPISGGFTVMNSMQAAICTINLGIAPADVCRSLAALHGVKGRMERVNLPKDAPFTVLIDYAHTPDALENLLLSVREIKKDGERIVLLFGCGGDRDKSKRPVMGHIASVYADFVFLTSDNSRTEDKDTILRSIFNGFDLTTPCTVISDRKEAIRQAILTARRGDIILLAGKGHEEYEIDAAGCHPFCEKEIVSEAYDLRVKNMD